MLPEFSLHKLGHFNATVTLLLLVSFLIAGKKCRYVLILKVQKYSSDYKIKSHNLPLLTPISLLCRGNYYHVIINLVYVFPESYVFIYNERVKFVKIKNKTNNQ